MSTPLVVLDDSGSCSVRCGGRCCEDFPINVSPEQMGVNYQWACCKIAAGEDSQYAWEIVAIAEMVVRIDEDDETKPRYTCRHLDREAGLCTIYDRRPDMCSRYPDYGKGWACEHCGAQRSTEI